MKAAYIETTGSPEVIKIGELPEPACGPEDLLIRVHATSVNPIDTYIRSGAVASELPSPYVLGCDAAGIVEVVGDQVTDFQVGDRVWCTNQGLLGLQGTTAEKIALLPTGAIPFQKPAPLKKLPPTDWSV